MTKLAIVIQITANFIIIKIDKQIVKAIKRGKLQQRLLVGDKVRYSKADDDVYLIEAILPRKNELFRPKIANVDQILIVNALIKPSFHSMILNKLLTIFHFYQIPVQLVFTKIDLVAENDPVWNKIDFFQNLNYPIHFISNHTKLGINKLILSLKGKLSLLTGISGVGKSSLINNLDSKLNLSTRTVSLATAKGRHTTTSTNIYFLYEGMVADSPGYMTLKMINLTAFDIAHNFPVIRDFINQCKFQDCLHQDEPGCAVISDLKEQKTTFFYRDYCKILKELQIYQKKE